MTARETLLAFACGVAAVVTTHTLIVDLNARAAGKDAIDVCVNGEGVMRLLGGSCAPGEERVRLKEPEIERTCEKERQADVAGLRNRVAALEAHTDEGDRERATAPFEVVNEAGIVVFSVNEPRAADLPALTQIYDETGARIARIAARTTGGEVSVSSAGPSNGASQGTASGVDATLSAWGEYSDFSVTVNSNRRLELGRRRPGGNYALATFNAGGKLVAGLGSSDYGAGIALVFDELGKTRIALHCGTALGPGAVEVYDAATRPVAALSGRGDANSGVLLLTNNTGDPMVKAEVFPTGIGAVRAGPGAFQHGKMFIGLPASYIEGKKP
jgi:hypothetical protein